MELVLALLLANYHFFAVGEVVPAVSTGDSSDLKQDSLGRLIGSEVFAAEEDIGCSGRSLVLVQDNQDL
jgi:hypothetical protein